MGQYTYGLQQLVAPVAEPISVDDMKTHLRVASWDADNGLISDYITAAREYIEEVTGRHVQAQYLMTLEAFPGRRIDEYRPPGWRYGVIRMPRPPLVSIDLLQYVDPTQILQTLDPSMYQVSVVRDPGAVAPAPFQIWPISDPWTQDAVRITFTCGYTTPPVRVRQAIRFMVGHYYENRELIVPSNIVINQLPFTLRSMITSLDPGEYV